MTNREIRVGIIGCGSIATKKHMPALKKVEGVKLVGFCDIIEERAQRALVSFGDEGARAYTDYKELLRDETIEVIHVCTPNRSHSFITVDALDSGKNVMCEKPMAINTAEAKKMLDAMERSGKLLTIGYQLRFRDEALQLKKEALDGTFGEIYYAKATALRRRRVPTWGVFLNEAEQGGGPLIDIGTHALDLTLWVMDNYKPKYCVGTCYHKLNRDTDQANESGPWDPEKFNVEDSAFGFVVMENGATIVLESSWALNTLDAREGVTTVCGTLAGADMTDGLRINGVRNGRQYVLKPEFKMGEPALGAGRRNENNAEREARLWIEAVRKGESPFTKPEEAYCVTRILEGIYESARTGTIYRFD